MQVEQCKYGATKDVYFELFEVDGVDLRTDWTPAASDCQVSTDGGAYSNSDNIAVAAPAGSGTYKVTLSASESTGKVALIKLVDAVTKVFLDKVIKVETYGNASAMHAFDLDTAMASQTVGTCTTNTDMRGTDNAALASVLGAAVGASISADIADIPTVAEFEARTLPAADYVVVTDTIAGVTLVGTCTTNTDMVTEPPTAAAIVNEWETQSQADPTGFRVNVMEILSTTADDILYPDKEIDLTTDPAQGQVIYKKAGTATVLETKDLSKPDGTAVTTTSDLIAKEVQA